MLFNEDIIKSQENLSKVNRDFLKFVEKTPESLNRSNFKILELRNELFRLQSWPTFINDKTKNSFKDAGEKIFELIKYIPKRVFNYDCQKMSDYYEVPLEQVESEMEGVTDDHFENLVGRGDFILSPFGLKCIEYNIAASMGGWQIPIWEEMSMNNKVIANFLNEYHIKTKNRNLLSLYLEHITNCALSQIPDCGTEFNIAFLSAEMDENLQKRMSIYLGELLNRILARKNKNIKGNVVGCAYSRLELVNDRIYFNKKRIHVVTEMDLGNVSDDVRKAFKARNILLVVGPSTPLLSHKLNLALLSDYENTGLFTSEEKKTIDMYIPWTRKINSKEMIYKGEKISNMETFLLSNQTNLVLKPSWGFGGDGVYVGRSCPKEEWAEAVKNAINGKSWLVQEFFETNTGYYQLPENGIDVFDMVWGFFVFGKNYSGAWVRVMPQKGSKGVINCHQGAGVSVIFEVEE